MNKLAFLAILVIQGSVSFHVSAQSGVSESVLPQTIPTQSAPLVLTDGLIELDDSASILLETATNTQPAPNSGFVLPPAPAAPPMQVVPSPMSVVPQVVQDDEATDWINEFSDPVSFSGPIGLTEPGCDSAGGLDCGCETLTECQCGGGGCTSTTSAPTANHWSPLRAMLPTFRSIDLSRLNIGQRFRERRTCDEGIGYERVMFAPNVLDTAIKQSHVGLRYQIDHGLNTPDRAEYFWGNSASTSGTRNESNVNVQDLSVRLAVGNEKAMALSQFTLRSLDPELNANTTGMGDMMVGAQALLVDGKRTKLSTILKTYLATGPPQKGLGTGNTSLEYGLLARHCLAPETYFFAETKYWMPIGGTTNISGDVFSTGWGISTIAAESDVFAVLPTLELRTLSFLYGGQSVPGGLSTDDPERIDGLTAVEIYPGARFVLGPENDFGLMEFGVSAGIVAGDSDWFDARWVFDIRITR